MKVALVVTHGTPGCLAAKQATKTIPIVMASVGDPVRSGLVASLARPGGNITGFSLRVVADVQNLVRLTPLLERSLEHEGMWLVGSHGFRDAYGTR